mgnify:CR=1 FL=1
MGCCRAQHSGRICSEEADSRTLHNSAGPAGSCNLLRTLSSSLACISTASCCRDAANLAVEMQPILHSAHHM